MYSKLDLMYHSSHSFYKYYRNIKTLITFVVNQNNILEPIFLLV